MVCLYMKLRLLGKISRRGRALPMDLRIGLHELVNKIINDLDYEKKTAPQRLHGESVTFAWI